MHGDLKKFSDLLSKFETNDKNLIISLTNFAKKAKHDDSLFKGIIKLTIDNVMKYQDKSTLYRLYIIDSIIKNIGEPYRSLYIPHIDDVFIHSFTYNKEASIRSKLYSLRVTWKTIFPYVDLNRLDRAVRKIDPAWPLFPPNIDNIKRESSKITDQKTEVKEEGLCDPRLNRTAAKRKNPEVMDLDLRKSIKIEEKSTSSASDESSNVQSISKENIESLMNYIKSRDKPAVKSEPKVVTTTVNKPIIETQEHNSDNRLIPNHRPFNSMPTNHKPVFTRYFNQNIPPSVPMDIPPNIQIKPPLQPINHLETAPVPKEPIWLIDIPGFHQFPQIGCDPRLLSRCPYPDKLRTITIDGIKYFLYLDLIQPTLFINNYRHVLRFYFNFIDLFINDRKFRLYNNRITSLYINQIKYTLCLGGPGHELIINGWPYNVPIDLIVHQIKLDGKPVKLKYMIKQKIEVNVLPRVPAFILEWTNKRWFGSLNYLSLVPLNPLNNMKLNDPLLVNLRQEQRHIKMKQFNHNHHNLQNINTQSLQSNNQPLVMPDISKPPPNGIIYPLPAPVKVEKKETTNELNVKELFHRLVKSGILKPKEEATEMQFSMSKFDESFKKFNEFEINNLSSGSQCNICGSRFKNETIMNQHYDYHFLQRAAHTSSGSKRLILKRSLYPSKMKWMSDNDGHQFNETNTDGNADVNEVNCGEIMKCPAFYEEKLNSCPVCLGVFDKEWDPDYNEEGCFLLTNAVLKDGKAYHPICTDDIDKIIQDDITYKIEECVKDDSYSMHQIKSHPNEALQQILLGAGNVTCNNTITSPTGLTTIMKTDSTVIPDEHVDINSVENESNELIETIESQQPVLDKAMILSQPIYNTNSQLENEISQPTNQDDDVLCKHIKESIVEPNSVYKNDISMPIDDESNKPIIEHEKKYDVVLELGDNFHPEPEKLNDIITELAFDTQETQPNDIDIENMSNGQENISETDKESNVDLDQSVSIDGDREAMDADYQSNDESGEHVNSYIDRVLEDLSMVDNTNPNTSDLDFVDIFNINLENIDFSFFQ